jgi:hypothetical protein
MLKAIVYLLLFGMGLFFVINVGPEIANARCVSKWKDSGLPARFIFGAGCMVEVDGKWVPEANVQISLRFKLDH